MTNAYAAATTTTSALKIGLQGTPNTAITTEPYGTSVTLTATVTGTGAAGTVAFTYGTTPTTITGCSAVTLTSGTAACTTAALPVATNESLKAAFTSSNTAAFTSSSTATATSFAVTQVTTTTALKIGLQATPNTAITSEPWGTSVTLTATVTGTGAPGTVAFTYGTTPTTITGCSAVTLTSGTAACTTAALPVAANESLKAAFTSTNLADFTSSSTASATSFAVTTATATNTLTAALTSALGTNITTAPSGANVTLTATISPAVAAGSVQFKVAGTNLGNAVTVSSGTASLATSALTTTGPNSLTAVFTPSTPADFSAATTTGSLTLTVTKPAATTALVVSAGPYYYGASVRLTANVTPSGATGGTVTFSNGSTCTLVSGTCYATTTTLPLGANSLTATYGGDTSYGASSASNPPASVNVVVNPTAVAASAYQLGTTTPLTNAAITYGNSFTLSATVTAAGSVTPSSGHVSFYDSSTLLASVAVNSSGVATLATSTTLTAGKHYFIASYGGVYSGSGGAELSTSLSSEVPVTISQPTPLTITASSLSVTYGSPVPAITASYTGYVTPDTSTTLSTATKQPICTTVYTATSPVGTYSTSCSKAVDTNYTISYATGLVTVTGAAPTWSNFNSVTVTYGTAVPLAATTNSGGVITYQISTSSHGGTQTTITSVPATEAPGTYYVTASVTANGNYAAASTQRTVTVNPPLTPTWSNFNSTTVTYGTAVPLAATTNSGGAITYQISTSSHGGTQTTITSVPATETPGTYYVTASVTANGNYAAASTQRTVTVNPAPLTITAPSPASTTFGSTVTVSASNAVFSGFVGSDSKSSLTGTLTCTADYTTISPPGTYITSCKGLTSSNYAITYADGSFVVTAAQPTITWPTTAGAITYGHAQTSSALGSCSATFNGSPVAGSCAWTLSSTIPHVGAAQSVKWTPSGEYAADYATTTNAALSFGNVTAATLTSFTDPTASSIPVGSLLSASKLSGGSVTFTLPATGAVVTVPGAFSWATSSVVPSVPGTSAVQVTFTPSGTNAADYNALTNAGNASLTVTKATPTITAPTNCSSPNFTYSYGQALSACSFTTGSAAVGSTPVTGAFAWANGATVPAKGTAVNESVIFTPTVATPELYNTVTFTVPVYVNGVSLTVNWPTASNITYGQTLSRSNLSGGYACPTTCTPSNHVSGNWAWTSSDEASSTIPHVGVPAPSVTFTPTNTNYAVATGTVSVSVLPVAPTVTAWPTVGSIFTPSTLAAATDFSGGTATGLADATVDGAFGWTDNTIQPGAGTAQYGVTFTPTPGGNGNPYGSSDYSAVNGSVSITVNPCGLQDGANTSFSTAQNAYTFLQSNSGLTFDLEGSINESVVCAQNTGDPFTVTLTDPALTSGSASTNTTDSITYGTNAAVLAWGPAATAAAGATIAIVNDGSNPTIINTTSDYNNGVFASMGGTVSVNGTGGATTISTSGNSSHALAATYAGTLTVTNVQATTTGNNSAVIMTGGGGGGVTPPGAGNGTVTVNGGSYSASGTHSSGIRAAGIGTPFSTITVTDTSVATSIAAQNDAAVVVEGGNSVTITNTNPSSSVSGAGGDYHGIFLYFGARGDASAGAGTFTMTGGTLTYTCDATLTSANPCDQNGSALIAGDQNYPATLFAVTNTTSENPANINLTDVTVINTTPSDYSPANNPNNPNGTLLTAAALSLGNPAWVNFTATGEQLIGDIIVDTNSTVNLTLQWDGSTGSSLTGNIGGTTGNTYYPNQGLGTINMTIDANSTWVVSGTSSYLTNLTNAVVNNSNITCQNPGQCAVYVGGSSTPLAGVN